MPQAAVAYSQPSSGKVYHFVGFVVDYTDTWHFGECIEGPHIVAIECSASSVEEAKVVLGMKAVDLGYGFDGVKAIQIVSSNPKTRKREVRELRNQQTMLLPANPVKPHIPLRLG